MKNKSIILIGMPCAGKSTIGHELSKQLGIEYISSGDIARNMGEEVNKILNMGCLAPENMMRSEIAKIVQSNKLFILDGFPRTIDQLDFLLQNTQQELLFVIVMVLPHTAKLRSSLRNRSDDSSINSRMLFWEHNTLPMVYDIFNRGYEYIQVSNEDNLLSDIVNAILNKYNER